jgi:serine/threonine protein kinase
MASALEERIGTNVGDYEIESLIGVGGTGAVYGAIAGTGARVALKLVRPDLAVDETFRSRFAREARIARTVRNPHLVPVLDAGEHEGLPYTVAQLIDGGSLQDKLKLEGRLDLPTSLGIAADVARGLEALWAAGMVHRDVKPANILLDRAGVAYVTDFGLARTHDSVLTQPGQTMGSLAYMAPEQILCERVTGAADIYSLGSVVFECLHGRPPFGDREGTRLLWAHLQAEPPDPDNRRGDLSPEFVRALKTALRKQPEERPGSVVSYVETMYRAAGIRFTELTVGPCDVTAPSL